MSTIVARSILEHLRSQGFKAFYAGGCVRDRLLGLSPNDYDIATNARPEQIALLFPRTALVGAQFGVILVLEKDEEIQVATFRGDGNYLDGRHPQNIVYTDAEEDAHRRDFTINGLFYDPINDEILDFVEGINDLHARTLRAIGNPFERFSEDNLRLLRAIRFATTLELSIDALTWEAIKLHAPKIHTVSAERIRDELKKILFSPNRLRGFDLLNASGLLHQILPELEMLKGCSQPPDFHPEGDVFVHTRLMLALLKPDASLSLILSVLFHDLGKPATRFVDATGRIRFNGHEGVSEKISRVILHRLRFPNEVMTEVLPIVRLHMSFKDVPQMRVATLKRMMARPTFEDELELHRVDCLSSHGIMNHYKTLVCKRAEFSHTPLIPEPLITGHDLIAIGWKPGKRFAHVLRDIQTRQMEGSISSRQEALSWIATEYGA